MPRFMDPEFQRAEEFLRATPEQQAMVRALATDGIAVIDPGVPDFDAVAAQVIRDTRPMLPAAGRLQDAWRKLDSVRAVATTPHVMNLLAFAYGRKPVPFQTLNFTVGTQQKTHSDAIHFDCFPRDFMCGVWVAYEDTDAGNGALHYVPGSHRLPALALEDLGIEASRYHEFGRDRVGRLYEQALAAYVERMNLAKIAKPLRKGQALIWTANMFHGGEPILEPGRTRYSQVTHYYFERCLYTRPLSTDLHGGRVSYRKIYDIAERRYAQPWYNGRPFRLPLDAHLRDFVVSKLIGVQKF